MIWVAYGYGALNRYVMLGGCIAIVLPALSAPVMWWKRRPKGSLGMPPAAASRRAAVTVMAIMAIAGVLYPLVGLSMLAGLVVERLYQLATRALDRRARVLQWRPSRLAGNFQTGLICACRNYSLSHVINRRKHDLRPTENKGERNDGHERWPAGREKQASRF